MHGVPLHQNKRYWYNILVCFRKTQSFLFKCGPFCKIELGYRNFYNYIKQYIFFCKNRIKTNQFVQIKFIEKKHTSKHLLFTNEQS